MVRVDPTGLATSLPGMGPVGTTQLVAMGRPGRLGHASTFKAFTGLTPRAPAVTKAGPCTLRSQLIQSADTARKLDPSSPRSTTPR